MSYEYTYSLAADFGGVLHEDILESEIEVADLGQTVQNVGRDDDVVHIIFQNQLSQASKTVLDGGLTQTEESPPLGGSILANHPVAVPQDTETGAVSKTVDPTISDGSSEGYEAGWTWTNVTTGKSFVCIDATDGVSVWKGDSNDFEIANRLIVGKSGAVDYTSIKEACAAAVAGGASSSNPWIIQVFPGIYNEDPMTIPAGVQVDASYAARGGLVEVVANSATEDLFTMTGGSVDGVRASGVTDATKALFRCSVPFSATSLRGIGVKRCSTGILVEAGAVVVVANLSTTVVGPGDAIVTAVKATGSGTTVVLNSCTSSVPFVHPAYTQNPVQTVLSAEDSATAFVTGSSFNNAYYDNTADIVVVSGGARCTIQGSVFINSNNVIRIGPSGSNSTVLLQGSAFQNNVLNWKIESSTGTIYTDVSFDADNQSVVTGGKVSGSLIDESDDSFVITGAATYRYPSGLQLSLPESLHYLTSSGKSEGGGVTVNSGLDVDVAAGKGLLRGTVGEGDAQFVEWGAGTLTLSASTTNYVVYDSGTSDLAVLVSSPSVSQILLATVVTGATTVRYLHDTSRFYPYLPERIYEYLLTTRKIAWTSGLATTQGSTARKLNVSGGSWYVGPDLKTVSGGTDVTWSYYYGSDGATEVAAQTELDITQYDSSGTLTTMTAGYFRADTLVVTSDGKCSIIYGKSQFDNSVSAQNVANSAAATSFLAQTACHLALVVVEQGVGIDTIVDVRPDPNAATAGGGGGGGGGDHSALTNLDKPGDHLWAMLLDGSRPMTGDLDMGAQAITNVGNIDGVGVSDHSSRHDPGGSDALTTGVPVAVQVGVTPSGGSGSSYALNDHQHGVAAGSVGAVGTANNNGSASTVARADHVHAGLTRDAGDFYLFTEKTDTVPADLVLIEDSEDTNNKKKVQLSNLLDNQDTSYAATITSWTPSGGRNYADVVHHLGTKDVLVEVYSVDNDETVGVHAVDRLDIDTVRITVKTPENVRVLVTTGGFSLSGGIDSDAIHDNVAGEISLVSEKVTPVSADLLLIEDSADSNNKKRIQLGNLPGGGDVTSTSTLDDNTLIRGDTPTKGIQDSGILVSDDDQISSVQTLTFEGEVDNGTSGASKTVTWGAGQKQRITISANTTLTFSAPPGVGNFLLKCIQGTGAPFTITWPATVKWPGGDAPTLSSTNGAIDIVSFYYDGTSYFGVASLDFA
jgi:hypothetical protein